jgi:hypothetical protein
MIPYGKIGQQVHAINIKTFGRGTAHRQEAVHGRGRILDTCGVPNHGKKILANAAFTISDLQHSLTGDLIDRRLKRCGQRSIDDGDGNDDSDT